MALAAALGADRCDIFTDVDGVYTTDPRIVAKARKLDRITYEEMLEMASLGAKVLQTRSVALAMQHRVRVQVLSSFEDMPGTLVVDEDEIVESQIVSGIAYSRDEARVTVLGVKDRPGVAAAIFGPLSEHGINVDMIVQSVSRDGVYANLTFTVSRADLPRALAVLERAKGEIGYERGRRRRRRVQGVGGRRRHAQPCRHRAPDVRHARRQGHQHPGDLDLRDQGQRADRRGVHRAGAARAALGLRSRQGLTGVAHAAAHDRLDALWQRGRRFLGSELAVLGGAMTWVSERHLVAAISNAGGFGVLACGSMGPELLAAEIAATRGAHRPAVRRQPDRHAPAAAASWPRSASTIGSAMSCSRAACRRATTMQRLKAGGAKVVCFAPSLALAKKLVRSGADALVIEGMEAGGHIGPVSTSVLAQEILPFVDEVPVFVAGGIGHGEMIAAYLQMGAAGVQMGTVFVCAEESTAHPAFKQAFIRAAARDAVPSVQIDPEFKVIPVRALANDGTRRFTETQIEVIGRFRRGELTYEEASLAIEHYWAGALRRAVVDGDVENGSLMAGQSVGLVRRVQPVAAILAELLEQAERALARRRAGPARRLRRGA